VNTKKCSKCNEIKDLTAFSICNKAKSGRQCKCKACVAEYSKANSNHIKAKCKRYYRANKEKLDEQNRQWAINNRQRKNEICAKYYKTHPWVTKAAVAKRAASKRQQTPKWLTKQQLRSIIDMYKACPKGYHVDHIVPLRGKNVSGLHVPWNLQILPASVNLSKSNK